MNGTQARLYWVFGCYIDEFVRDAAVGLFGCTERAREELERLGFTLFDNDALQGTRHSERIRGFFGEAEHPNEIEEGWEEAFSLMPNALPQFRDLERCRQVVDRFNALPEPLRAAMSKPGPIIVIDVGN